MKKKITLRNKIARYLLVFAGLLIGLLVLFQLVLLQPMYEHSKRQAVARVMESIKEAVLSGDDETLQASIYKASAQSDTCVRVIDSTTDSDQGQIGCVLYRMSYSDVIEQANLASENNDEYVTVLDHGIGIPGMPDKIRKDESGSDFRSIVQTDLVDTEEGTVIVMVYAGLSPVNATTQTLSRQIFFIAIIVVLAMLILTRIMNRHITQPLSAINAAAKSLPEGIYESQQGKAEYEEAQELDETLTQAAEDIRKADKTKRDLIANVSHDLRTPLALISGYGQMMKDLPGEKTDENIQVIIDESNRLTYLVNDLLDLSKLQENKITLERTDFSLTDMLKKEIRKYDVYKVNEGFEITLDADENLIVNADEKRIEQVFNNFMTNAINYSGSGRIIEVRAKAKGSYVHVEVQDHGEGIPEDKLNDIWDRYYKVDKTHVRAVKGSGIGLSIVKQVLELHHARYGVSSRVNEGSIFWFDLPLVKRTDSDTKA
ncbi:MAG: HAMP domain-containing sensor histidine kinase [Bulleidia sp.]|nr:HAMP domain-containing sensor histidine kinase [Bulleidia sp.]